jgi:hypothetical protein
MNEFNMDAWFDEEIKPDEVSLLKFDGHVADYMKVRKEADALEEQLTVLNKKMMLMQSRLIEYLEAQGKTSHELPEGMGRITRIETQKFKAPDSELRLPLVDYLKETNQYDSVMAFNATKFHSWYKSEKENNPNFNFNGVEVTSNKYLKYTKGK